MKLKNFKSKEAAKEYIRLYNISMNLWPKGYVGYYVDTSYGKTWIHEMGSKNKPVLLLLHGMSNSSALWYPNMKYLSTRFRVIVPDIIGQAGKSILEQPLLSPEALDNWLDELIDGLQVKEIYLAGFSFGGWLATRYTIGNQKKITKLALLDPVATFVSLKPEFLVRMLVPLLIPLPKLRKSFVEWVNQGYQMNEDFRNLMVVGIKDYAWIREQKTILAQKIPSSDLNKIKIPVLVLVSERSVIHNPRKAIKQAQTLLPYVRTELISDCCHLMNLEKPEVINSKLVNFYDTNR